MLTLRTLRLAVVAALLLGSVTLAGEDCPGYDDCSCDLLPSSACSLGIGCGAGMECRPDGNVCSCGVVPPCDMALFPTCDGSCAGGIGGMEICKTNAAGNACECQPTTCGDGILDPDERCDDGNNVDGDGCSADCTVEAEPIPAVSIRALLAQTLLLVAASTAVLLWRRKARVKWEMSGC